MAIEHTTSGVIGAETCPDGQMLPPGAAKLTTSQYAQMWESGQNPRGGAGMDGPSMPFAQVNWVYACITAIASNAARVPIRLSRGQAAGTRGVWGHRRVRASTGGRRAGVRAKSAARAAAGEIVETGDLYNLLTKPNGEQRFNEFMEISLGLLYTQGRVHWLLDDMVGRRPLSMYPIGGNATTPIVDKSGRVDKLVGWRMRGPEGRKYDLALDEVVTYQLFDPHAPREGMSPDRPATLAIVSYYNADLYNAAMFGNSCEPGGMLKTDDPHNPEQEHQIRTSWQQRHQGAANARRMAILWGGMSYEPSASTMADMQYIEGMRHRREDICSAYRVPPSVAGFVGVTGDSTALVESEQERFWQDTEGPLLEKFANAITYDLCPRFLGGLEAWADVEDVPVFQRMRRSRIDAVGKLFDRGVPMADLNAAYDLGLPERDHYGTGFLPISLVPADQAVAGHVLPPLDEGPGADDGDDSETVEPAEPAEPPAGQAGLAVAAEAVRALADGVWESWQRSWAPLAKRLAVMLRNHYAAQGRLLAKLIRERLGKAKADPRVAGILVAVFDDPIERDKFVARVERYVNEAGELGLRQSLTEAGLTGEAAEASLTALRNEPSLTAALRNDAVTATKRINAYTRRHIRAHLAAGLDAGETVVQLADRVEAFIEGRRASALTTARNEVAQALSRTRRAGRIATGMTHEVWVHSRGPGERREAHVAAEAHYAAHPKPIRQRWIINGVAMDRPRDPAAPPAEVINCQCLAIGKLIRPPKAAPSTTKTLTEALGRGFITYAESLAANAGSKMA